MLKIDQSVYPDVDAPPVELHSDEAKADYVARICGAWDFGIVPTRDTFAYFATLRAIFDRFPILNSPSYHAFRLLNRWPPMPGGSLQKAFYELLDEREGRSPDPFTECV